MLVIGLSSVDQRPDVSEYNGGLCEKENFSYSSLTVKGHDILCDRVSLVGRGRRNAGSGWI